MGFFPDGQDVNLILLLDIEVGRRLDLLTWVQAAAPNTACWYIAHPEGSPTKVEADGAELSAELVLADCQSTEVSWFYDPTTLRLYVHIAGGGGPTDADPYLMSCHWERIANDAVDYAGHPYYPALDVSSIPDIGYSIGGYQEGNTQLSFGVLKILNGNGHFDALFDLYIWEAKRFIITVGEKGHADADFIPGWTGWTGDIEWSDIDISITTEDLQTHVI
jgi:hypothetical protein